MAEIKQGVKRSYGKSKVSIVKLNLDTTGTVPATSGTKTVEIRPPEGEIWRLKLLTARAQIPTGGASGTHRLEFLYGLDDIYNRLTTGFNDWNLEVYFTMNFWKTAKAPIDPTDVSAQGNLIKDLTLTSDTPLYIKYSNLTNVVQDKPLIIRAVLEKEVI